MDRSTVYVHPLFNSLAKPIPARTLNHYIEEQINVAFGDYIYKMVRVVQKTACTSNDIVFQIMPAIILGGTVPSHSAREPHTPFPRQLETSLEGVGKNNAQSYEYYLLYCTEKNSAVLRQPSVSPSSHSPSFLFRLIYSLSHVCPLFPRCLRIICATIVYHPLGVLRWRPPPLPTCPFPCLRRCFLPTAQQAR